MLDKEGVALWQNDRADPEVLGGNAGYEVKELFMAKREKQTLDPASGSHVSRFLAGVQPMVAQLEAKTARPKKMPFKLDKKILLPVAFFTLALVFLALVAVAGEEAFWPLVGLFGTAAGIPLLFATFSIIHTRSKREKAKKKKR